MEALQGKQQQYFCLIPGKQKGRKYFIIPCFSATDKSIALILLSLQHWRRRDWEIHFSYRNGDERGLYEMEDLSDGELMWLARIGLIIWPRTTVGKIHCSSMMNQMCILMMNGAGILSALCMLCAAWTGKVGMSSDSHPFRPDLNRCHVGADPPV